jgi:DNA anti-recombination protein RmuC
MPGEHAPKSPSAPDRAPEIDIGSYLPNRAPAAPKPPPVPRTTPAALSAMHAAIGRLQETVDDEIAALADNRAADFADINRRKSQSLLEITRLARTLPVGSESELASRLRKLSAALATDHRLLGLHLAASRQLSDLMIGVLHEAESDGTYGETRQRGRI